MTDSPTPQEVRRALARAERGAALDVGEATALLSATGEQLDALCAVPARVRDAGLVAAGPAGLVTYSAKVFVPVTPLCSSWVKLGVEDTRARLNAGANDVGGTLMEETISRMAGSEHGSAKTVAELVDIGTGVDRPVERTTTYGVPTQPVIASRI